MADFLEDKRHEIGARLKELKPLVEEYQRLEAAAAALAGISEPSASAPRASRRRTPATRPARKNDGMTTRGRSKRGGKRSEEAFAVVKANPGITIPQIAERMGIKQNYLYRVLPSLASEGRVQRDGRGWHPVADAKAQ